MLALIMTVGDDDSRANLTRLYEDNFPAMCKAAEKVTGEFSLAEDAAAAAMELLIKRADNFNLSVPRAARSLMVRMSLSAAIDIMRKRSREPLIDDLRLDIDCFPSPEPGAEELAIASEMEAVVLKAVAELPLELYLDYIYSMRDGLSPAQIAEIDGITPDGVRKRLARIRGRFYEKLKEGGFLSGDEQILRDDS